MNLASCQVSLNSFQRFRGEVENVKKKSLRRRTDGRNIVKWASAQVHLKLWVPTIPAPGTCKILSSTQDYHHFAPRLVCNLLSPQSGSEFSFWIHYCQSNAYFCAVLARLHFSAGELLLYPWRQRQRPCQRRRRRPNAK